MFNDLRSDSQNKPDQAIGIFSENNPDRRLNIGIAVVIAILLTIFGCVVFFAIRNHYAQPAPAPAAPVVMMASGGDLRICPDSFAKITFEDADKENPLRVDEIAFVKDVLWLNLSTVTPLFGWAKATDVTYESGDHPSKDDAILANVQILDKTCTPDELTTPEPVATEPLVATEEPVVATEPPVTAPEQAQIVDFTVPGDYVPLFNEDGEMIGITYPIQDTGPHSIPSCNKCTLIVAVGKFTFSGTIANPFTGLFGASEVTGNILAGVCDDESGCVTPMIGVKAGHAQVTIVFPEFEIPNESAAWSVNFMFNPESSNCGDGCKEVYFGNLNTGAIKKFDTAITAPDLDLVAPTGPYPKINIVVDGTPSGSKVILNDAGDPIGQKYYLTDKDAFISIPEDGGTVFYFGAPGCIRDGISQKAGDVVTMHGIKSDGGTPHDQNETVEVVCSQPEMVLVHFFHGGIFEDELAKLKSEYPDWVWP